MALERLIVELGGLCMIVQDDRVTNKLAVLLPEMKHSHMLHCATLEYMSTEGTMPLSRYAPLDGQIVDLTGLAAPGAPVPLGEEFAKMSRYAGRSVAEQWLTSTASAPGTLAARIDLPLGSSITPLAPTADMIVPEPGGGERSVKLYGRAEIAVTVTTPDVTEIVVGKTTLRPDAQGLLAFRVLNIRLKDLTGVQFKHTLRDPAHHLQAYYQLLEGWPFTFRDILVGADVSGDDDTTFDLPCLKGIMAPPMQASRFVDTYNCTVGGGCPPGNPNC